MPKKELIAFLCLMIGLILEGFAHNILSVVFFLIALALDASILVEWYKTKKKH